MKLEVQYLGDEDYLVTKKAGEDSVFFVKDPKSTGQLLVKSKVTFKVVGLVLTGFKKNWARAPMDRICGGLAQHYGIDPGEMLKTLTSLKT